MQRNSKTEIKRQKTYNKNRDKKEMEKQELIQKIQNILVQVRPYLAADGGGVEFVDLTDDMVVLVELTGACGSCPHSTRTLKNGIEKTIKSILPEIKAVENVK